MANTFASSLYDQKPKDNVIPFTKKEEISKEEDSYLRFWRSLGFKQPPPRSDSNIELVDILWGPKTDSTGFFEDFLDNLPKPREIFNNVANNAAKLTKDHGLEFAVTAGISMGIKVGLSSFVQLDPVSVAAIAGGTSYLITAAKQTYKTYKIANANLMAQHDQSVQDYKTALFQSQYFADESLRTSSERIDDLVDAFDKEGKADNIGLRKRALAKSLGTALFGQKTVDLWNEKPTNQSISATVKRSLLIGWNFLKSEPFLSAARSGISVGVLSWAHDLEPVKAVIENATDAVGHFFQEKMGWLGQIFSKADHDLPTETPVEAAPEDVPAATAPVAHPATVEHTDVHPATETDRPSVAKTGAAHHATHHTTTHPAPAPHPEAVQNNGAVAPATDTDTSSVAKTEAPNIVDNDIEKDVPNNIPTEQSLSEADFNEGNEILGKIAETKDVTITFNEQTNDVDINISPIDPDNPLDQEIIKNTGKIHGLKIEDVPEKFLKPTLKETFDNVTPINPPIVDDNVINADFTPKPEPLAPAM